LGKSALAVAFAELVAACWWLHHRIVPATAAGSCG